MAADDVEWTIATDDVEAVKAHLDRHFPGGQFRALSEPSDPGQLFQVVDREGTRYTLKIVRAVLDDLRSRKVSLGQFLAKQEIARRMRRARRVVVLRARGEDMIREERA